MKVVCPIVALAVALSSCMVGGCDSRSTNDQPSSVTGQTPRKRAAARRRVSGRKGRVGQEQQRGPASRSAIESRTARTGGAPRRSGALGGTAAIQRTLEIVQDSVDFAPTLVVWLVDISPSAMQWASEIRGVVRQFYEAVAPKLNRKQPDRLQTAVLTISKDVEFVVRLTDDSRAVIEAFDAMRPEKSGREVTFDALRQAREAYLSARIKQRREVLFVIITDEAGDDWGLVDALIEPHRKYAMPVYVVGVPAPLGRYAALDARVEEAGGKGVGAALGGTKGPARWRPILQGPESRYPERIQLEFDDDTTRLELIDSGFGPFALERICRASGGSFIAVRGAEAGSHVARARRQQWPTYDTLRCDPKTMRRYIPDDLDEAGYQLLLQENEARAALHRAAQLPRASVLRNPQLVFLKRSEADLKNRLDKAQQAAAKVAPAVDQLYELLRNGAGASAELTRPRWQAACDLAFGRTCAAKARIDGYNSMLAALKRGRPFEQPDSKTWVLERFETTEASSSLQNLVKRARMLLQRVVDNHPGTPWAKIAQSELETPMGWRWTERP